ncbi:MAG: RnfABCDGE type electron transport complex subunit B [Brachymonas sp.]
MTPHASVEDVGGLVRRIHQVLPQTQCRRCGEQDCAAYAQAVVQGTASINQCPPGGKDGIARIARAMGQPELARGLEIDPTCGSEGPVTAAVIDENWCIGCTLCIRACPTEAIVGSRKRMHTVLPDYCTGCELCVLACPVDCIAMEPVGVGSGEAVRTGWQGWSQDQANLALQRYTQRQLRLQRSRDAQQTRGADEEVSREGSGTADASEEAVQAVQDRKRAMIEAALARARRGRQLQD